MDNISKNSNEKSVSHSTSGNSYVSCIKIDGIPILPPLLDDKDRDDMRRYKKLAIDVQDKLKQFKIEYRSDSSVTDTDIIDDNFSTSSTGSFFTDFSVEESTMKFSESCQNDIITMLKDKQDSDSEDLSKVDSISMPLENISAINYVPLSSKSNISEISFEFVGESSETINYNKKHPIPNRQLSHTIACCEKVFSDEILKSLSCVASEPLSKCDNIISKLEIDKKNNNIESSDENYVTANENVENDKTPNKLIRSHSFILEKPSPMLMAQIERENMNSALKIDSQPKRKTWDMNAQTSLFTADNKTCNIKKKNPSKTTDLVQKNIRTQEICNNNLLMNSTDHKVIKKITESNITQQKRKGWDLTNAREKWTSIENDLGKSRVKKKSQKFNSLPPSAAVSPEAKMFNSTIIEPTNLQIKITENSLKNNDLPNYQTSFKPSVATNIKNSTNFQSKTSSNIEKDNKPLQKNSIIPKKCNIPFEVVPSSINNNKNDKNDIVIPTAEEFVPKKPIIMSTPKKNAQSSTSDVQRRILRGCITPIKTTRDVPSHEYSPRRIRSAPRPVYKSPKNKTDMLLRNPNFTLYKPQSPYYFVSERDRCFGDGADSVILPEKENDDIQVLFHGNNDFSSEKSLDTFTCNREKIVDDALNLTNVTSSSKNDIKELFNKMQEIQKKQMAELMKRQKEEQELFLKKFAEQQALLLTQITEVYSSPESQKSSYSPQTEECKTVSKPMVNTELLQNSESLLTECRKLLDNNNSCLLNTELTCDNKIVTSDCNSSQTLYAFNSSNDTLADPNLTLRTDTATDQSIDEITIKYLTSPCNNKEYHVVTLAEFKRSMSDDSLETAAHLTNSLYNGDKMVAQFEKNITVCVDQKNREQRRVSNCSRALFPSVEQIRAANIICAGAKGYLVRRLLKSERVQNLIQTIKDTLLCAMDLHHENVENIQPSDIELHRRLIQQVTAACVAFHEMFFKLTIKEQMVVIAQDRERQKEKSLRPISSRSSSLSTTTQKVIERKLRRGSSVDLSASSNRSSFSRSCRSAETRTRIRSVSTSESLQYKKSSPSSQDTSMRRSMGYGANNKKPWR